MIIIIIYSALFWLVLWQGNHIVEYICRVVSALMMVAFLYCGWEAKLSIAVYNAIWAISIWQVLEEICSMIELIGKEFFQKYPFMIIVGMILLYIINHVWVAKTIGKWMPVDRGDSIGPRQLGSAILIFGIIEVLSMSPILRNAAERSFEWRFLYVCQFLAIVILYLQNELFKKSSIKQERDLMNMLWKNKQEQYEISKENIELINQKPHDLKHQIQALRKLNKEEFDKYLDDLEDTVGIYESIVKTGNDVFDTILTEKSLYFEDPEKRQIDVTIHRHKNFLVMNFMNPISEKLVYKDEFPVTTKEDKKYHGFGLRSIKHFVKKYDGVLNVSEEDGCFSLKIMIPIMHKNIV